MDKLFFNMLDQRKRKLDLCTSCCCQGQIPSTGWPVSYAASGFHRNICSWCGQGPIRHIARLQVCSDIFSFPLRFLFVPSLILAEAKQLAWLLFVPQSDFCSFFMVQPNARKASEDMGLCWHFCAERRCRAGDLEWRACLLEGFPKLKYFGQQQRGSVEAGTMTPQVDDRRFAGLSEDIVTKVLFSSFHFG